MRSMRSRKYGIQPVPPSESANRMPGNFGRIFDHMMSAAHWHTTIGCSVIITSTGASAEVCTSLPPEPRWIDTTVSVSVAAAQSGIPRVGVEARVVEQCGVLGERQRVAALGRGAAHLGGGELGVPQHRERHRDEPVGVRTAPLVDVPVVVRLHHREGEVLVGRRREQPAGEARERREVERAEHAARVHVLHPLVDVPAARGASPRTTSARCRTPRAAGRRPR